MSIQLKISDLGKKLFLNSNNLPALVEIQQELASLIEQLRNNERARELEVEEIEQLRNNERARELEVEAIKALISSGGNRFEIFERAMAVGYYDVVLSKEVSIALCISIIVPHFEDMNNLQQLTLIERITSIQEILGYQGTISIIEYLHEEPIIVDFMIEKGKCDFIEWKDYIQLLERLGDKPNKSKLLKKLLTGVFSCYR